jgi:tetratricopeptide (TPR) repeat protein
MVRLGCGDALAQIYTPILEVVDRRLEDDPRDVDALVFSGILLGNIDKLDDALGRFERSLELAPASPAGLFNLGLVLIRLDRPDEARVYLEKFIELYPEHPLNGYAREQLDRHTQKENE